jgi:hypothetical protein
VNAIDGISIPLGEVASISTGQGPPGQLKAIIPCRSDASSVEEIIPPTIIGTAMRCITSEPAPVLQRMGSRPAMIGAELQQVGREAGQVPSSFIVRL